MKLKELLKLMRLPILIAVIVITIFSILYYFFGFQLTLVKDTGVVTRVFYTLFYQLDITHETTLTTWFLSLMFLLCAVGFMLIGWGDREKLKINFVQQGIYKLFSVVCIFLAIAEMYSKQNLLVYNSESLINLFVYLSLILVGIIMFIYVFKQLINNIKIAKRRIIINHYFKLTIILISIYLILVAGENYLLMSGHPITLIPYFVQLVKLGMIYNVYILILKISDNYNL